MPRGDEARGPASAGHVAGSGTPPTYPLGIVVDERALAERLISYDTSRPEELAAAAAFVKGWLEAREIEVREHVHNGLPVLVADVGPDSSPPAPTIILHGHLDVVPGHQEQYEPRVEGDRLIGRGAYDMKGGLAAMMCAVKDCAEQDGVRVRFLCVPDEEAEDVEERSTDELVRAGMRADFAITGEPTDLHIGIEAKGVLAMRIEVGGRAAHGSTPWLGDSAVLKAFDVFRRIEALDFARESSELFDRPSINLGRIEGGDVFNKVPDRCEMVVDIRYLPGQDPGAILAQIRALPDVTLTKTLVRAPAHVERTNPYVRALRDAARRPRTRSRSSRPAYRRSSSVPSGAATTARRSGSRSHRCGATARRSAPSCARCRSGSRASARPARAA